MLLEHLAWQFLHLSWLHLLLPGYQVLQVEVNGYLLIVKDIVQGKQVMQSLESNWVQEAACVKKSLEPEVVLLLCVQVIFLGDCVVVTFWVPELVLEVYEVLVLL